MQAPQRILVIVTRRIGDVLLATPLIRSLKAAWPGAAVDVLLFDGTQGILSAHSDVCHIHFVPERLGFLQHIVFITKLFRRYDLALSLVPGDRSTLYAWFTGRWRAGLLIDHPKHRWKQWLLDRWVAFDDLNTHTVRMHLALTDLLGITPSATVTAAWNETHERELTTVCPFDTTGNDYAVLHMFPKFHYKMWHVEGWVELAQWLSQRGLRIVLSGGASSVEREYVSTIAAMLPDSSINLAGKLSLPAAACLVSRARLYVGPDTAMTHIAAAADTPTIALFGPSNPVKWGPWPRNHALPENPWRRCGSQRRSNVLLLQGAGACVPCHLEGCERHVESYSDCLRQLPAARVIRAAEVLLSETRKKV